MHLGLITFDLAGHLNPLTALGAALRKRGHRVTVLGGRTAAPYAARAGLEHAPIGVAGDLDVKMDHGWRELGRLSGIASMRHTGGLMATISRMLLRDAPGILTAGRVDGVIVDQLTPAGFRVAEQLGLPTVIVCNALACHNDTHCPPPPTPWRYRGDWLGWLRNKIAMRAVRLIYNRAADSAATGVSPLRLVFEHEHGLAQLAQQPAFFDFPRKLPDHFHYTAPWHADDRDDDLAFPWDRLDGRPLIYASMGTLQNNLAYVFAAIAEAARGLDAQVVLTQGGGGDDLALDLPENVILVKRAPQLRLLDRAALAITHAGLNTALECVTRGVPMVCLPVTNDQPGVASRVEWLGLGEMLPVQRVTAQRLRERIDRVFRNPKYVNAAARRREELSGKNGAEMAADIVERAYESGQKVRR